MPFYYILLLIRTSPAETIPLEDGSTQIVSASQACHWFDLPTFFKETQRVLCSNGILALSGYTFPQFIHPNRAEELQRAFDLVGSSKFMNCIRHFIVSYVYISDLKLYRQRTGSYWGSGRELVDNEYSEIVLPFQDFTR